jgi:hypothetical protein
VTLAGHLYFVFGRCVFRDCIVAPIRNNCKSPRCILFIKVCIGGGQIKKLYILIMSQAFKSPLTTLTLFLTPFHSLFFTPSTIPNAYFP